MAWLHIHPKEGVSSNQLKREVSLAEGEAPYIIPSNTLRTSTVSICLYVVRFLICN